MVLFSVTILACGTDVSPFDEVRVERPLPKMYDLQRLYAAEAGKSGQTALKTEMEDLGVEVDEERSFHNAMHDAYYTAQVLRKLSLIHI